MRRWLAVLAGVAIAGIGAIGLALRNAEAWIDARRDWIAARIEAEVGRPVSFGAIDVSLFPTLAVRVADVWVGDDPRWPDTPFVVADSARVAVAILPALLGRIAVRRVALEAPVITLVRDDRTGEPSPRAAGGPGARGRRRPRGPVDVDELVATVQVLGEALAGLPLAVGSARIVDGRLRLLDAGRGRATLAEAHDVDVTVSGVSKDRPARLEARAALFDSERQNATLAGTIGPFDEARPGRTPLDLEVAGVALDVARLRRLPDVAAAVPEPLRLDGPIDVSAAVRGDAGAPAFEARFEATRAHVGWAEWFAKPPGAVLSGTAAGTRRGAGARFERFAIRLGDLEVTGHGDASPERVAVHLEAVPAAVRSLSAFLPALAERRLDGAIGFAVDATGAVAGGRTPAVTGTVTLRDVSIASREPRLDVRGLTQTVRLEGDVAVLPPTSFSVNGVPANVSGRVERFTSPVARLADLDLHVFGGRIGGTVELDRRSASRPRFAAQLALAGIDVAAAVATRAPDAARTLGGRLSGDLTLGGTAEGRAPLRERLAGQGRFAVADGTLYGVNLAERVLAGLTRVPGLASLIPARLRREYPAVFGAEDTRFDEMTATWRLAGGVTHLDRVVLAAEGYAIEGRGTLAANDRLAATGTLELSEGLTRDLVRSAEVARLLATRRGRIAIPFAAEGTWPRVRVTPDVGGLARSVPGGGAVQEGLERLLDQGLERLLER